MRTLAPETNRLQQLRLLCHCLAPDIKPWTSAQTAERAGQLADESNWPELIRMAGDGLVTPSLAGALKRRELFDIIPEDAQIYLTGMQELNKDRNDILREELHRIVGWLNEIDIQPVLLKGAINLVTDQYPGSEDRVIADLDLLVPAERIKESFEYIQQGDYQVAEKLDHDYLNDHHHAAPVLHTSKPVSVELHRFPCTQRLSGLLPTDGYWAESIAHEWQGRQLRLPGATSRVAHIVVHTQISDQGYLFRYLHLRALLEFAWQVHRMHQDIDWQSLDNRLHEPVNRQHRPAFLAWFQAVSEYFGQDPPTSLSPGRAERWRAWQVSGVIAYHPVHFLFYWNRRVRNKLVSLLKA